MTLELTDKGVFEVGYQKTGQSMMASQGQNVMFCGQHTTGGGPSFDSALQSRLATTMWPTQYTPTQYTYHWNSYPVYTCTDKTAKAIQILKQLESDKIIKLTSVKGFIEMVEKIAGIL